MDAMTSELRHISKTRVSIQELPRGPALRDEFHLHKWKVQVRHGIRQPWECNLTDPALEYRTCSRQTLRWLFEKSRNFPFEPGNAQLALSELVLYAESLSHQLGLLPDVFDQSTEPQQCQTGQKSTDQTDNRPRVSVKIRTDASSASVFHGILWESLECLPFVEGNQWPIVFQVERIFRPSGSIENLNLAISAAVTSPTKPTFNVLFVVSRPDKDGDIDPNLASASTLEVLSKLEPGKSAKVSIEVTRPGTWAAFQTHISSRTADWHRQGGSGPWFDIVHFDVHGVIEKSGKPFLRFLATNGRDEIRQSATKVGDLLRTNGVKVVLLNSCESAVAACGPEKDVSNFAAALLGYGVSIAIAMQFPLTVAAADIFVQGFYLHLFWQGQGVLAAAAYARGLLISNRSRPAGRRRIELPDFVIPVVYRHPYQQPDEGKGSLYDLDAYSGPDPLSPAAFKDTWLKRNEVVAKKALEGGIFRRSYELMALEWVVLHPSFRFNVVLITGLRGSGRTALVLWLCYWWPGTGLCQHASYFSCTATGFIAWLRDLYSDAGKRDRTIDELRKTRDLLVIDGLELLFHRHGPNAQFITENDRMIFRNFITRLQGGQTIVILTSTSAESWLDLPPGSIFRLGGLSLHQSLSLAQDVLGSIPTKGSLAREDWGGEEESQYLRHLCYSLHFNPASIIAAMKGMLKIDNANQRSFKTVFQRVLVSWFYTGDTCSILASCIDFIKHVHANLRLGRAGTLLLLGFAVPTNTFSASLYALLATEINKFYGAFLLRPQDAADFVEDHLLGSGWIEELVLDKVGAGDTRGRYFLVHPILTNSLRILLHNGQASSKGDLPVELDQQTYSTWERTVFARYYLDLVATALHAHHRDGSSTLEARLNQMNYLSVLRSFEADPDVYARPPNGPIVASSMSLRLSLHLCRELARPKSNLVALPYDVLLGHARGSLDMFDKYHDVLRTSVTYPLLVDLYVELAHALAHIYFFKDQKEALHLIKRLFSVRPLAVTAPFQAAEDGSCGEHPDVPSDYFTTHILQEIGWLMIVQNTKPLRAAGALVASIIFSTHASRQEIQRQTFYRHFVTACTLLGHAAEMAGEGPSANRKFQDLAARITKENMDRIGDKADRAGTIASHNQRQQENALVSFAAPWTIPRGLDTNRLARTFRQAELLIQSGKDGEAQEMLAQLAKQAEKVRDSVAIFFCHRELALAYMPACDWDVAAQHARECVALYAGGHRDNSHSAWVPETDLVRTLKFMKLAFILIQADDWFPAMCAFKSSIFNWSKPVSTYPNRRELSDYATPLAFLAEVRPTLGLGIAALNGPPYYIASAAEVKSMHTRFVTWFRRVVQAIWPSSDVPVLRDEDIQLVGRDNISTTDCLYAHSGSQLDATLQASDEITRGTYDYRPVAYLTTGTPHLPVAAQEEYRKATTAAIQQVVDEAIHRLVSDRQHQIQADTAEQDQAQTSSLSLPQTPKLSEFMDLARQNFIDDVTSLRMQEQLVPVVTWGRLLHVVYSWVADHIPRAHRGEDGSRWYVGEHVFNLVMAIYEVTDDTLGGRITSADANRVSTLLLGGEDVLDADAVVEVIRILGPGYYSAVWQKTTGQGASSEPAEVSSISSSSSSPADCVVT